MGRAVESWLVENTQGESPTRSESWREGERGSEPEEDPGVDREREAEAEGDVKHCSTSMSALNWCVCPERQRLGADAGRRASGKT